MSTAAIAAVVNFLASFPSGHTVYYTAFLGFLWFLTFTLVKPQKLRWPLLALFGGSCSSSALHAFT
jgi:membrane-associated phospholipid phosphatase